jgi:hypothetical protein
MIRVTAATVTGQPEFRPYVRGAPRPAWMLTALGPGMAAAVARASRSGPPDEAAARRAEGGRKGAAAAATRRAAGVAPVYQRIADVLRGQIAAGDPAPGAALPAVHALEQQHEVSATTIKNAIAVLRAEGLVWTSRGRGTYVTHRRPPLGGGR